MLDRNYGVIRSQNRKLNSALVHGGKYHRRCRKELLPVPLDKGGRRRADANNQIRWSLGKERAQIFDKCGFRIFIAGTSRYKRMVSYVQRPW